MYDSLLGTDATGAPFPHVAMSWETNIAGTEYTFASNDDVLCHDGLPLDANDVKYTVDLALSDDNLSLTKRSWGPITSVDVIDNLTVKFTLKTPFVAMIPFLADGFSSILCDSNKNVKVLAPVPP